MTLKRIKIDEDWLAYWALGYADDCGIFLEFCQQCRRLLGIGDYIDGLYPHDNEYSICDHCRRLQIKQEKRELIQL